MNTEPNPLNSAEQAALQRAAEQVRADASQKLAALRLTPGGTAVVRFIGTLHGAVDRVVQDASQQGAALACGAGCSHCCNTQVMVQTAEALLIGQALHELEAPALAGITQRLQDHGARLAELGPGAATAPWSQRPACAFLVKHLCSIYALRPAVCRKAHSLDVKPCAASSNQIPQSLQIVAGAEALIKGTADAYAEQGLQNGPHELCGAVFKALNAEHAQAQWLTGGAVF